MKFKVEDNWGMIEIVFEDGSKSKLRGQMVEWNGTVGRIWSVSDKSSHNGGHGMGQMTSSQAVIATKDMNIVPVKLAWDAGFELNMLGSYGL